MSGSPQREEADGDAQADGVHIQARPFPGGDPPAPVTARHKYRGPVTGRSQRGGPLGLPRPVRRCRAGLPTPGSGGSQRARAALRGAERSMAVSRAPLVFRRGPVAPFALIPVPPLTEDRGPGCRGVPPHEDAGVHSPRSCPGVLPVLRDEQLCAMARYRCSLVTNPRSSTFPARTRFRVAALAKADRPSTSAWAGSRALSQKTSDSISRTTYSTSY